MAGPPPPLATSRREAILAAALELFCQGGFHAVGVDEIGTTAGISGPGVYRHFTSKTALLVALLDSISERMVIAAEDIEKADDPPVETLDRLIAFHAATAVTERALLAVWIRDGRSVPHSDRERLRSRHVEYVAHWTGTLARLRPELAPAEAEALVHAALGTIDSAALHDSALPAATLEALLADAARTVLHRSAQQSGAA